MTFSNIGHQPFWNGPQDTTTFLAALAADRYDWAEFVTHDFEIHAKTSYMQNALIKPWVGGDADTLYDRVVSYPHPQLPHVVARPSGLELILDGHRAPGHDRDRGAR